MDPQRRSGAVLLAALVGLRSAVDAAFPGLVSLISGPVGTRGLEPLALSVRRQAAGPYRERQTPEAENARTPSDHAEQQLLLTIERSGARAQIARGLSHAVLLGSIGRGADRLSSGIGWLDKFLFWSESSEQAALAELEQRREWHRLTVSWLMEEMVCSVDRSLLELPLFRLRNLVVNCHYAVARLTAPVLEHAEALRAIGLLASEIGQAWGLSGTKQDFALRIAQHLTESPPVPAPVKAGDRIRALDYRELVVTVAEALRSSDFVMLVQRLRAASYELAGAHRSADAALPSGTFWDWLSLLDERAIGAWRETSTGADFARANRMMDDALAIYPPAVLYFALGTLEGNVSAVFIRPGAMTDSGVQYELVGKEAALEALQRCTLATFHTFGAMPPNGELVEWFVARELA